MRNIDRVILHCSDSDHPHHDNIEVIRSWHLDRGWNDVGYHFVILKSGKIEEGRQIKTVGAHCKGYNSTSIGICLTGKQVFSDAQFEALGDLIRYLRRRFDFTIHGHNEFSEKTCPNFDVSEFIYKYV